MLSSSNIGTSLGPYQLIRPLGQGTGGRVWLAKRLIESHGQSIQKTCALKERSIHQDSPEAIDFIREWSIGNTVQHPNVVKVHHLERLQGRLCVEMEYIDGRTLEEILGRVTERQARIPLRPVVDIAIGISAGLQAIHEARAGDGRHLGLVHRDIKPSNIMVDRHSVVKILDLGIVRGEVDSRVTEMNMVKGTRLYMSPEQHRDHPLGPGTDIFALGAVLFELLTGETLFSYDDPGGLLRRKSNGSVDARLDEHGAHLGPLLPVLSKCLRPDIADRYPSAADLERALRDLRLNLPQGPDLSDLIATLDGRPPRRSGLPAEWQTLVDGFGKPYFPPSTWGLGALPSPHSSAAIAAPSPQPEPSRPALEAPRVAPAPASAPPPAAPRVPRPAIRAPAPVEPAPASEGLSSPSDTLPEPSPLTAEASAEVRPPAPLPSSSAKAPRERRREAPPQDRRAWLQLALVLLLLVVLGGGAAVAVRRMMASRAPALANAEAAPVSPPPASPTPPPPPAQPTSDAAVAPPTLIPCYIDADRDGWGGEAAPDSPRERCEGEGVSLQPGDCDDRLASVNPGAREVCDGRDTDCKDGAGPTEVDADRDGDPACRDCDDTKRAINHSATEIVADGIDQDCNGKDSCYADNDRDGYGSDDLATPSGSTCYGAGVSGTADDCDDTRASIHPHAKDAAGDGVDADCDGKDPKASPLAGVRVSQGPTVTMRQRRVNISLTLEDPNRACKSLTLFWSLAGSNAPASVPLPSQGGEKYAASFDLPAKDDFQYYMKCCYSPNDAKSCIRFPDEVSNYTYSL